MLPKDHPLAGLNGASRTITTDGFERDENNRNVLTEKSTPVRFLVDIDTDEVNRIDIFSISTMPDGLIYKVQSSLPEEPLNFKSMGWRAKIKLVEELLEKYKALSPPTQKPREKPKSGPT